MGGGNYMATLNSVVKKWQLIPSTQRSLKLARAMAKSIVLKMCGISGKKYLKSMGEAVFLWNMLDMKKNNFNNIKYEQDIWEYTFKVKHYHPDFKIKVGNTYHWIEYKGKMVGPTRTKLIAIKRCNPDKSLILVFERGKNKLSSKSKTTYMEWAEQQGFPAFDTKDIHWKRDLIEYLKNNSKLLKGVD